MKEPDVAVGLLDEARSFTWRDGERTVSFRSGLLEDAFDQLRAHGWGRYELLSTRRALDGAPASLVDGAVAVHEVPGGPVTETATVILERVNEPTLVALGGGRVIDTAKAVTSVLGGAAAAIPTTLSGAEMTSIHRLPPGRRETPRVRPAIVLADPVVMTSLPEEPLRASAVNSLAHGIDPLYTPFANPVASIASLNGARLIAQSLDQPVERRDRARLALGSLLCAYALDSAGLALHHVICQSLVREMRIPHSETYAALLPATTEAMLERAPEAMSALAKVLGCTRNQLPARIRDLGGDPPGLSTIGADPSRVDAVIETILSRPELSRTPQPPGRTAMAALIAAAW